MFLLSGNVSLQYLNNKTTLYLFVLTFAYSSYSCEWLFGSSESKKPSNGTPMDVINNSSKVNDPVALQAQSQEGDSLSVEVLNQKVFDYLDFSSTPSVIRTFIRNNINIRLDIHYIGELIQKSKEGLFGLGFREDSVGIIEEALAQKGLYLDTKLDVEWTPSKE